MSAGRLFAALLVAAAPSKDYPGMIEGGAAAFPPYEQLVCNPPPAGSSANTGMCYDMHPTDTFCALRQWITRHDRSTKDYDFALQSEAIMAQVFASVPCVPNEPIS